MTLNFEIISYSNKNMTWNKFLFEEFANLTAFECALIQTNFKIRASRTAFPAINQVCFYLRHLKMP